MIGGHHLNQLDLYGVGRIVSFVANFVKTNWDVPNTREIRTTCLALGSLLGLRTANYAKILSP